MANALAQLQIGMALMGQTPAVTLMATKAVGATRRATTRRRRKKKATRRRTKARRKKRVAVKWRGRLKKGSPAAKRRMAQLRRMRKT